MSPAPRGSGGLQGPAPVTEVGLTSVRMLPGWEETINMALYPTWKTISEEMEQIALRLVPVRSGELKGSLKGRVIKRPGHINGKTVWAAELTAGAPHALFVEYGTGRRGRGTAGQPKPEGYRHGAHPGMEAQPYMRPALNDVLRRWFGGSLCSVDGSEVRCDRSGLSEHRATRRRMGTTERSARGAPRCQSEHPMRHPAPR